MRFLQPVLPEQYRRYKLGLHLGLDTGLDTGSAPS